MGSIVPKMPPPPPRRDGTFPPPKDERPLARHPRADAGHAKLWVLLIYLAVVTWWVLS